MHVFARKEPVEVEIFGDVGQRRGKVFQQSRIRRTRKTGDKHNSKVEDDRPSHVNVSCCFLFSGAGVLKRESYNTRKLKKVYLLHLFVKLHSRLEVSLVTFGPAAVIDRPFILRVAPCARRSSASTAAGGAVGRSRGCGREGRGELGLVPLMQHQSNNMC